MKSILIIEDEETIAKAICHFVTNVYSGTIACLHRSYGPDALDLLRSNAGADVVLVLVDLQLLGMGGREVVKQIFDQIPRLRGRLVVCSGEAISRDDPLFAVFRCLSLEKPFEVDRLREIVSWAVLPRG